MIQIYRGLTEPSKAESQIAPCSKAEHHPLWQRLAAWHPDDPECVLPFSRRLQQENGWTPEYSDRAIDEYRRFLFLAQVTDHVVCPSEDVDQVWHQHLTCTRSYWDDLCGKVLNRPLHHQPTKGGHQEHQLYLELYSKTLASYEEWFGSPPDQQLWPEPMQRFAAKDMQRVDRSKYFLIRRPKLSPLIPGRKGLCELLTAVQITMREVSFSSRRKQLAGFGLVVLLLPAAIPFGPLEWAGPEFLQWYVCILVGAVIAAFLLRHILWPQDPDVPDNLSYFEAACLQGNWKLAANAVLAELMATKHVTAVVQGTKPQFLLSQTIAPEKADFESAVVQALNKVDSLTLTELHRELQAPGRQLEDSLRDRGFLTNNASYALAARFCSFLVMATLVVIGLAKMSVGVARGKPVGFLIVMMIVPCILAIWFLIRPRMTSSAKRWVRQKRQEYAGLKEETGADQRPPEHIGLRTALFGAAALAGTQFLPLRTAWQANRRERGSSGCGTAGCGTTGCGGGGGGGGDGGSGCGGCGGD